MVEGSTSNGLTNHKNQTEQSVKLKQLGEIIDKSSAIVFFGGAGVSTESGVPDFRSDKGLYNAVQKYGQSPETMLSYSYFMAHTDTFFDYYKNNLICRQARPNKAHLVLAELENALKLKAIVTQNIDGLHQMAGSHNVFELHGSVLRNYCMDCGQKYELDYIMDPGNCRGSIPICKLCNGIVRPDVILYEEGLDTAIINGAIHAIQEADTLIVGGTSLVVYPAAGLVDYFNGTNLILINKSTTKLDRRANLVIQDAIGEVLFSSQHKKERP
jgi:NAD-dependent deacetylase